MQETHDLNGWVRKLQEEEMRLADPATPTAEAARCVLHIANIAEAIKHKVDEAIHRWNAGRQFRFFLDGLRVWKHSAFEANADLLAQKCAQLEVKRDAVLTVLAEFQEELLWLLKEIHEPEWLEPVTDQVIAQETTVELETLPYEALPKPGTHRAAHGRNQAL